jgi:AAT family amino acid transporter/GABA permease
MLGWAYWSLWTVAIAIEALAGAGLLQSWIPLPTGVLSAVLVLVMMGINLLPARTYGEFEFWFSSVKVLAIILFVVIAGAYGFGSAAARAQSWHHLTAYQGFMPHGVTSVLAGVVTVFFSLTGAELTTIAAAESSETAASSRIAATLIGRIVLFYVGSVFLIVSVIPWTEIRSGESPFTVALKAMGLPAAEVIMALIITTALLSCLNSAFYISSRVLFGLATQRDAPGYLLRLTSRRVPAGSVVLGGLVAAVCLILAFVSPQTAFAFLVNATGTLILFVYLAVCVSYLVHNHRRWTLGHREHPRRQRVMRWTAYGVLAVFAGVLVAMALNPQLAVQLYVSVGAIAVYAGAYFLMRRHKEG